MLNRIRLWLRSVFLRGRLEREMHAEMEIHLQRATERLVARGMSPAEAHRAAQREFGNIVYLQEQGRDARGARWVEDLAGDIRYAGRALLRNPGFSVVAILSIALGIGGTTAVFTLADEVVLRTLPVQSPEQLVIVKTARAGGGRSSGPSYPAFERIRDQNQSFQATGAYGSGDHIPLVVDGQPEQVFGQLASVNFFDLLGVKPRIGRLFNPQDDRLEPAVAVISHHYWQRRFGGSPDVLGRVVHYSGQALTIVGVTPPAYRGLEPSAPVDITMPITMAGFGLLRDYTTSWIDVIARQKPDVTTERARAEIDAIYQGYLSDHGLAAAGPAGNVRIELNSAEHGVGRVRGQLMKPILLILALVIAVLAIACANIANLLLARGAARQREMAVRTAIGAGRLRIIRQLLTESIVLFAIGSVVGLVFAGLIGRLLADFLSIGRLPIVVDLDLDVRALLFTGALCLVTGIVSGLVPALRAARGDTFTNLRQRTDSRMGLPVSRWLVALQVAASMVILVDGSLLVRTLRNLRSLDAGFRAEGVLTLSVQDLATLREPAAVRRAARTARRDRLWTDLVTRIERLPRVESASLSFLTPLSGRDRARRITVPGFQPNSVADQQVHYNYTTPGYFDAFGIRVLRGRAFDSRDVRNASGVAIINEATARFYFGTKNPIGQQLIMRTDPVDVREVIGVVADTKHNNLRDEAPRFVTLPLTQSLDDPARLTLAVRTIGDPIALLPSLRREIEAIDREVLISDVMTMERQLDQSLLRERLLSALSTAFAALGVLLATIGLYGLVSYSVVRRRSEIGIRLALGGSPAIIRRSMLRGAVGMVALGTVVGLPLSLFAARAIRNLLFGVTPTDPASIVACVALMTTVAGLAAYIPARRASRIQPTVALTSE